MAADIVELKQSVCIAGRRSGSKTHEAFWSDICRCETASDLIAVHNQPRWAILLSSVPLLLCAWKFPPYDLLQTLRSTKSSGTSANHEHIDITVVAQVRINLSRASCSYASAVLVLHLHFFAIRFGNLSLVSWSHLDCELLRFRCVWD